MAFYGRSGRNMTCGGRVRGEVTMICGFVSGRGSMRGFKPFLGRFGENCAVAVVVWRV